MQIEFKCPKDKTVNEVVAIIATYLRYSPRYLGNGQYQICLKNDYRIVDLDTKLALWYRHNNQKRVARALVELFQALYCGD